MNEEEQKSLFQKPGEKTSSKNQADKATLETLEGELKNIVFANESGSFTVARLTSAEGGMQTIVGNLAGVKPGEFLRLQGGWAVNPKYGKQFQVKSYMVQSPKTLIGLERYLASGVLPGIGPKTAERIVKEFGNATLEVLEKQPERLRVIPNIGQNRIEKIIAAWQSRRSLSEVMVFLQAQGISPAFAERIYRLYRDKAVSIIRTNPYRLAWEVHGIGFKKADQIAKEVGIDPQSPLRCEAAVLYMLRSFADQGHVFYPLDAILNETTQMLEVSEDPIGVGIQLALNEKRLVMEEVSWEDEQKGETWRGQVLYLEKMYSAETSAAAEIARLLNHQQSTPTIQVEPRVLDGLHTQYGLELGDEQQEALQATLENRVSVITGGPGTGKTTMIRAVVSLLRDQGKKIVLAAPTGRAAKRLSEATGEEAKTIHRLLEYRPRERLFARNRQQPLEADWVIVDESSMIDIFLLQQLLEAIPDHAGLLLVGDVDQLPSVGSGSVLKDIIDSKRVVVSRLRQIYRQARGSFITMNAHSVNRGEFPKLIPLNPKITAPSYSDDLAPEELNDIDDVDTSKSDFYFIREDDSQAIPAKIAWLCNEELPRRFNIDVQQEVQIITPMHRGDVGSLQLNQTLQNALNPAGSRVVEIKRGDKIFRIGDRVMQLRNNYDKEVFNGDIGQITNIDLEEGDVKVRFDYVEPVYSIAELDEIDLAYAVTVHKSQGSEYPVVIMPITTQHFIMLQRNLLYTAITRGKNLVILIGSTKAVAMAVKNDRMTKRYSLLGQRLQKLTSFK